MPRNNLTISPTPYKSSYLAIPPTPFSPLLPLSPPPKPEPLAPLTNNTTISRIALLVPPPAEPLHWLWQCHKCARVYQLGVTRRCLDDGHFFCAGTTVVKRSKRNGYRKTVRHAACASEFDYSGWKAWGGWRRGLGEKVEAARALEESMAEKENWGGEVMGEATWFSGAWGKRGGEALFSKPAPLRLKKDCWARCDYPSECRWGKQFGVATPTPATVPSSPPKTTNTTSRDQVKQDLQEEIDIVVAAAHQEKPAKTTFDDILIDLSDPASLDYLAPLTNASSASDAEGKELKEGETKMTSMGDLLQSAKRRKRKSSNSIPLIPSPLALNPPSPPAVEEEKKVQESGNEALNTLARVAIEDGEKEEEKERRTVQARASEFVASWKFPKSKGTGKVV